MTLFLKIYSIIFNYYTPVEVFIEIDPGSINIYIYIYILRKVYYIRYLFKYDNIINAELIGRNTIEQYTVLGSVSYWLERYGEMVGYSLNEK